MAFLGGALLKVTVISVAVFVGGLVSIGVAASARAHFLIAAVALAVICGLIACFYTVTQWIR